MNKLQTKRLTAVLLFSITLIISIAPAAMAEGIYVNTSGWWYQTGAFNASATPIQHAIDNATAGEYGGNCCG